MRCERRRGVRGEQGGGGQGVTDVRRGGAESVGGGVEQVVAGVTALKCFLNACLRGRATYVLQEALR